MAEAWLRGKTDALLRSAFRDDANEITIGEHYLQHLPADPTELDAIQAMAPVTLITESELLDRAASIKSPAPSTLQQWKMRLREFLVHAELVYPSLGTKAQARLYRDKLVRNGKLKASTIKMRVNYLSGLWSFMVDEELVEENIWSGITRRLRVETTQQAPIDIEPVDRAAQYKLSGDHLKLFLVIRYTGMRVSEAAGLRYEDIDTTEGLIHLREHELRPMKSGFSRRTIPLHPVLLAHNWKGSGLVFPRFYNPRSGRWGSGLGWPDKIGISPHKLRHHAKQAMREAGIDSAVSRAVLGHKPENVGEGYGGITITQKIRAVETLG
ncbi:Tyrosine recombinase XerC [Synechococcus sp. CBW1107]|nr:Tyrosine recombinase XerC [Synechococcus sp. CBW1107]